jgi:hypothetical protein
MAMSKAGKRFSFHNLNATWVIATAIVLFILSFIAGFGHELLRMARNKG